jgi:hypothetical protein
VFTLMMQAARGRAVRTSVLIAAALMGAGSPALAQRASSPDVKAAFILNFTKFIEWPAAQLPEGQPMMVGVIGPQEIADSLAMLVRGKTIDGRAIVIKTLGAGDDPKQMHVLFVGESERSRIALIVERIGNASVLTVSDAPRFCSMGGIIQLRTEDDRVRFDINLDRAGASGLVINSKLLALAGRVNPPKAD